MKCCKISQQQDIESIYDSDDEPVRIHQSRRKACLCTVFKWTTITILVIALILFLLIFVVLPLVIEFSLAVQTFMMFPNILQPKDPQYNNFAIYGATATRNIYPTVDDYYDSKKKISIGMWHLVPEALIGEAEKEGFDYDDSLMNSGYPVVLYFHGNSGTRIAPRKTYFVLRKYFHVLAYDYRSYGDSTEATLSENAVVSDGVKLYKWVQSKTKSPIYVWGHSLGTALSTHTVANLRDEHIVPMGLFLEAAFTSMKEEIPNHPLAKYFTWLPWFDATIVEPLQKNGFLFDTKKNILNVDCPIMQMHAVDDPIIPYTLGRKLSETAKTKRDPDTQGSAIYHEFPAYLRYNHLDITKDPNLPKYIGQFIDVCKEFHKKKSGFKKI